MKKPCSHIIPACNTSHVRCRIVASISHWHFSCSLYLHAAPEMSVRMSNLDNERDERDEDSHEDRGISKYLISHWSSTHATKHLNIGTVQVFDYWTGPLCWPACSLHLQSVILDSSLPWSSDTLTLLNGDGGTGDDPGRRVTTVRRIIYLSHMYMV